MTKLFFAATLTLISSLAFAQIPASLSTPPAQAPGSSAGEASLATRAGSEVNVSFSSYNYEEPGATSISIHGAKIGGQDTTTLWLSKTRHWFALADVRGSFGSVTYDGWCSPWLITPDPTSPNGYGLDVGDYSPCSEAGDKDWYLEARPLVGKDFIGQAFAFSPFSGLGVRYLSNGTTGIGGYRTDSYLYLPFGFTARTRVASQRLLSFNGEYDAMIHGWQTTRDSELGGGDVPPTPTAPGFTIDGFTDISFDQHGGWALRVSGKYQATARVSVEPYYIRWNVNASPVNYETATFTVHNITADRLLGVYEPLNHTNEFGVKLGFRF